MLRSGSICASLLYKYLTTSSDENIDSSDKYQSNLKKVKLLGDTFADYGGVLSKISQMVNYAYGVHNSNVYSDCKPINEEKTIEFFESEILEFEDELQSYDLRVFKSGSVGQVHKAVYKDGREIVFKVQYVGLNDIFESDLYVLDMIAKFLFSETNMKEGMADIQKQLWEELDYRIEARNQDFLGKCWKDDIYISIPKLIPELCNEKLLCMEYVSVGESLNEFLDTSTKEEITFIGNQMVRFMFTNLFNHKLIYTDVHYGNFIIQDKSRLVVLDFGSVNYIDDKIYPYIGTMLSSLYEEDKVEFYSIMESVGVIHPDRPLSPESSKYMWDYFTLQLRPWIQKESEDFEFTSDWLDECGIRNVALMNEWVLPSNMIWLNKLCHGFTHVIGKMNFKGNYVHLFKELGVFKN